jgi:hypothetical protein
MKHQNLVVGHFEAYSAGKISGQVDITPEGNIRLITGIASEKDENGFWEPKGEDAFWFENILEPTYENFDFLDSVFTLSSCMEWYTKEGREALKSLQDSVNFKSLLFGG